jgi:hypothetical protein
VPRIDSNNTKRNTSPIWKTRLSDRKTKTQQTSRADFFRQRGCKAPFVPREGQKQSIQKHASMIPRASSSGITVWFWTNQEIAIPDLFY